MFDAISWRPCETAADLRAHFRLRREVFVVEQAVDIALEFDEADFDDATLAYVGYSGTGETVAAGRALAPEDGHIHLGRLAVARQWRGRGVGRQLVECGEHYARLKWGKLPFALSAQTHAIGFYERLGYVLVPGEPYLDAGIPHRDMIKQP
ncbi:MAG: GNAT family N-acetyltransferase [Actinomycetaceae bacterium]|nr:GNAT family N-acetyltransferase [Actinomycetaceae bacterium]